MFGKLRSYFTGSQQDILPKYLTGLYERAQQAIDQIQGSVEISIVESDLNVTDPTRSVQYGLKIGDTDITNAILKYNKTPSLRGYSVSNLVTILSALRTKHPELSMNIVSFPDIVKEEDQKVLNQALEQTQTVMSITTQIKKSINPILSS